MFNPNCRRLCSYEEFGLKMKTSHASKKALHSEVQSRIKKKRLGSFYTPQYLANLIAEETLNAWLRNQSASSTTNSENIHRMSVSKKEQIIERIRRISILDPAVGAGAFLLAAAEWLLRTRVELGEQLGSLEIRSHIIENCLFGVDLVDDAVSSCKYNLQAWAKKSDEDYSLSSKAGLRNIRRGNSLIGFTSPQDSIESKSKLEFADLDVFHWNLEFKEVFNGHSPGFDVILGNPPYGSILNQFERQFIKRTYPFIVGGSHDGTWNSAAHFIVRARTLLKEGGTLGFLVPNSILRVGQFRKTRSFLLDKMRLWKIIDEGSPFDDVTLEMVTMFSDKIDDQRMEPIAVESRRPGHKQSNNVEWNVLKSSRVFPIYHDAIFARILKRGKRNLLRATRGRDLAKEHVSATKTKDFTVPYITSGKSVQRFHIVSKYQVYADNWYNNDEKMRESFQKELLVATKNYRYPRCVIKPPGMIHGGGIVNIVPLFEEADKRALGLILNSHLIRFICVRYLTNYSQLTTCLNTGIVEDIPLVIPKNPYSCAMLFEIISKLYGKQMNNVEQECAGFLEKVSNALVYDLYFNKEESLHEELGKILLTEKTRKINSETFCSQLQCDSIMRSIEKIMEKPIVQDVERGLVMK
jgi:hypothetical protein